MLELVVPYNNPRDEAPTRARLSGALLALSFTLAGAVFRQYRDWCKLTRVAVRGSRSLWQPAHFMSNVISMDDRRFKSQLGGPTVRDRRYAIRYPFAADAELIDLASGARIEGVTSDLSKTQGSAD
jgi:hypothetical protein